MYKDYVFAAWCRREGLVQKCLAEPVPQELFRLYAMRMARTITGAVGTLGFLALLVDLFLGADHAGHVLMGSWVVMLLVFPVVLFTSRLLLRRSLGRLARRSDDLFEDLRRLDEGGPLKVVLRRTCRLELASLVLPVVALTLLAPLSLHLVVGSGLMAMRLSEFNVWVLLSLVLVGHAHLTLLVFSVMHVVRVKRDLDLGTSFVSAAQGFWALLWTVTASAIPGAVLLFVPPILVALTGLLFVPWMFLWVGRRARRERLVLHSLGLEQVLEEEGQYSTE